MTNPIELAARAKGSLALFHRVRSIAGRYGLTTAPMEQALQCFAEVLRRFDCGASFPITAVALKRNSGIIARFQHQNFEFVVHGYTHVDYVQLSPKEQVNHLQRACAVFNQLGIAAVGFRSPYLRRTPNLHDVIEAAGFSYACNQPILWDVLNVKALDSPIRTNYERALAFYEPWNACARPSLPWLNGRMVEIPVSLPDDEILIDRLNGTPSLIEEAWLEILSRSYQRGELFTLLLHPERIAFCASALSTVLTRARSLTPAVWCARLDEVAAWWKARARAMIEITDTDTGGYHCVVTGPPGTTVLARAVEVDAPALPWVDGYCQLGAMSFTLNAPFRPFIGLSPGTSPELTDWLRQQGFIIEISQEKQRYRCYFDQPEFTAGQEPLLLAQIEKMDIPLVRLGRWPNGARSAVCITGDIDALTLWDYGLRLVGR